ncbi:MAG: ABC transporter ATP-binding protein [Desulfamplus sp.]|nr:ABC transporter ATP-binding protein [Desulfamplus sp.]
MTQTAFLEIQNLSCGYDKKVVQKDISFIVEKGEILTIIGPNGSGKTTLLKTIPSLVKSISGKVLLAGRKIDTMPLLERASQIAMVMQAAESVYMTVEEYVLLGRLPYFKTYQFFEDKKDLDAALKYMEFTNILHLRKSPLSQISSGERQLATIAKALVQEPALLLMDEPTSHLDISHQAQILKQVVKMKNLYGLTVLMVQHDLNLASEYSDKVVLLDKKSKTLFRYGTPGEVITRENIKEVYHTDVVVETNPHSKRPCVFIRKDYTD